MNAALILIIGIVILFIGYVTYIKWLAENGDLTRSTLHLLMN